MGEDDEEKLGRGCTQCVDSMEQWPKAVCNIACDSDHSGDPVFDGVQLHRLVCSIVYEQMQI